MSPFERVDLNDFAAVFGSSSTELSSVALGGRVVAVSDEFFAEASNLLKVGPAPSLKGQFGPKGALFDGWESRRHNPTYDWCIIRLGVPSGYIAGFDIDTANFSGNEAPEASVQALFALDGDPTPDDDKWTEILPRVNLGPSSRHLFRLLQGSDPAVAYTHVKLNMYPDGGIARFRVYGLVVPIFPPLSETFDLAHVLSGGRVVQVSDQHFGIGPNLLLPGRGKDMGDGWETRRSRIKGHRDWAIIRLGDLGILDHVEIDTAHFKGNFPESCELHATTSDEVIPPQSDDGEWTCILPRVKLGPHRQHFFPLENTEGRPFTHVRLTIYPDGGVKRVRIFGKRTSGESSAVLPVQQAEAVQETKDLPPLPSPSSGPIIPALPLTPESFFPFGDVIMAWSDLDSAPKGTKITQANFGTAHKFHRLSRVASSYPEEYKSQAVSGISVFRCTPPGAGGADGVKLGGTWDVKVLERHSYTDQSFIPMGNGEWAGHGETAIPAARGYLVIVALNGEDDKPDLKTLRAFIATTAQGITYRTGIWHHPMIALERTIDFACIETQIGSPNNKLDCEIVDVDGTDRPRVSVPLLD